MPKFICVQGSPEIPKGSMVEKDGLSYALYIQGNRYSTPKGTPVNLEPWQIEGNECWEEVKEEAKAEDNHTRWKPKVGEKHWLIDSYGIIHTGHWEGAKWDEMIWSIGNCFQTEQDANDELKRRESIANAWKPIPGEYMWVWNQKNSCAQRFVCDGKTTISGMYLDPLDHMGEIYIGAIHPTEEACKQWGETYAHLFVPKTV